MPTKWNFEAEYIQSCNCAWGCPCNFDALPTTGNCEALVSWHIRKGAFGPTKLDGTTFAWGLWWPRAIHMGNGMGRVYVDPKAKPAQREPIRNPVTGAPFEGYILLPGGINMKKSTVTNIRRWSLRDEAAGWNMSHENVAGFVTVQRYNEKGPVKRAG